MKSQKMLIPVIAVILLVFIAITGFFIFGDNKGSNSSSRSSAVKKIMTGLSGDCKLGDADLCRYGQALIDSGFYSQGFTAKSMMTDKDGKKSEGIFMIAGEDKFQMISYENGKETANTIYIDNVMYTKDMTDNQWFKYETKPSTDEQNNIEEMKQDMKQMMAGEDSKNSYKKIGKEACSSRNCFKYQLIVSDFPDLIQYIYFDDQLYLMRKTLTMQKDGSVFEITYDYEISVNVNIPSPIKSLDNKNLLPTSADNNLNQQDIKQLQKQLEEQIKKSQ